MKEHFRCDQGSISFRKLARKKWICRETCDFFRDQITLLTINSVKRNIYFFALFRNIFG